MNVVEIKTLVDITATGIIRLNQGTVEQLNQNRNFVTLNQCIEIRSLISYDEKPYVDEVDIKGMGFGTKFKGKQKVWTFRFETDRPQVFGENCELLIEDLNQVPMIKNLTESVNIDMSVFDTTSVDLKNTIIRHPRGI
jgi:hypothetical protein